MSTTDILTSPIINGTPSGNGLVTLILKRGDESGNYTTSATSFQDVDITNLAYSVFIPRGWKLTVNISGGLFPSTLSVNVFAALFDGSTLKDAATSGVAATSLTFFLQTTITGDDATHHIRLRFKTSNGAAAVNIVNSAPSSVSMVPSLLLRLEPAN